MAKVKVAWRVVLSFLESVESERCWQELFSKTLLRLESIAPYDYALAAVSTAGCLVDSDNLVTRHIDDSLMDRYFNHFITIDPVLPLIPKLSGVTRLDWAVFRKTEYYADFMRPNAICYTLGFNDLQPSEPKGFWIALHRGGRLEYSEREAALVGAVLPHLHNLFLASVDPAGSRNRFVKRRARHYGLTVTEESIAVLLCDRLSSDEIGERLCISKRTVDKHLEHLYAKLGASRRQDARNLLLRVH